MQRDQYFNQIESRLTLLAGRIKVRGCLNVLNFNIHAENFYAGLLNEAFDYNLKNMNVVEQNAAAIDLVDHGNKIIVQVSSTSTKEKIQSSLSKLKEGYVGYRFVFCPLVVDASQLRTLKYKAATRVSFDPAKGVLDIPTILRQVLALPISKMESVCELVRKEIPFDEGGTKLESNLAIIIDALSKEDLSGTGMSIEVNPYELERKISFNQLDGLQDKVMEHAVHYSRLDRIYSEFDRGGVNKSAAVLSSLNSAYLRLKDKHPPEELFFKILDIAIDKVKDSLNFRSIPHDELELAVIIVVIDAFIRCKIFKNPNQYTHVAAR